MQMNFVEAKRLKYRSAGRKQRFQKVIIIKEIYPGHRITY